MYERTDDNNKTHSCVIALAVSTPTPSGCGVSVCVRFVYVRTRYRDIHMHTLTQTSYLHKHTHRIITRRPHTSSVQARDYNSKYTRCSAEQTTCRLKVHRSVCSILLAGVSRNILARAREWNFYGSSNHNHSHTHAEHMECSGARWRSHTTHYVICALPDVLDNQKNPTQKRHDLTYVVAK